MSSKDASHAVFTALQRRAEAGGVRVRSPQSKRAPQEHPAEFSTHHNGKKRTRLDIVLRFDEGADGHEITDHDAVILAHEMGHWRRWLAGMHPSYRSEILETAGASALLYSDPLSLSPDLLAVIYDEERAAWDLGRAELAAVGFENWALFESLQLARLNEYRAALRLLP